MEKNSLLMKDISKKFPGVVAIDKVTIEVYPGEIMGLVGENGAGKSTLMNVLGGIINLGSGQVYINGKKVKINNPFDAQNLGIGYIHQELELFPILNIVENIFMSDFASSGLMNYIKHKELLERSSRLIKDLGLNIDPKVKVGSLSYAEQSIIEIAKALSKDAKILIFDEPTASLTDKEKKNLFRIISILKEKKRIIIFISHNLDEVLKISDRIIVMRDGRKVIELERSKFDKDAIIKSMIGREVKNLYPKIKSEIGDVVFRVRNLNVPGKLRNISFDLKKGEIFGISGLLGSGRTELAKAIFSLEKISSGEIFIENEKVHIKTPQQAIKKGIGFVTEDRHKEGLVLIMNVRENLTLTVFQKILSKIMKAINRKEENKIVKNTISLLDIKTTGPEQIVNNLSGGNQQKVVLGKWLETNSNILILDEPTRGIDVGTKAEVHKIIGSLVKRGASIILISSEIEELIGLADRIGVMCKGQIKTILGRKNFSRGIIMKYSSGVLK